MRTARTPLVFCLTAYLHFNHICVCEQQTKSTLAFCLTAYLHFNHICVCEQQGQLRPFV